jgi:benzoate-CoA ligase
MNRIQPSAASKSELPSAAMVPRDYNFAADILKRNIDAGRADKIAFIDHRGKYSYADLADRVERFGHVLRAIGVRSEERVLICLLDTIDWPIAFLGAIKAGVVAVPVNTLMTEDDYRFMLEDSRARVLVVSEELLPKFKTAIAAAKSLEHVIVSGAAAHGHHRFADLLTRADNKPVTAPTTCDDMCFWLYTSGSTGKPKGAVHTHADLKLTDELYVADPRHYRK